LEKTGLRRRSLANRKVICISETPTGDALLDEALRHIKDTKPLETTQTWIDYLSGISCLTYNVHLVKSKKKQLKGLKMTTVTVQAGTTKVVVKVLGRNT